MGTKHGMLHRCHMSCLVTQHSRKGTKLTAQLQNLCILRKVIPAEKACTHIRELVENLPAVISHQGFIIISTALCYIFINDLVYLRNLFKRPRKAGMKLSHTVPP